LPARWASNKEGLLSFMEFALRGVRGIVRNAVTGLPVKARVEVQGLPTVPVFSDSLAGDYHRLLRPGTYTLLVKAAGYRTDTLHSVVVTAGPATRRDVMLQPLGTTAEEEPASLPARAALLPNFPNPFNPTTTIRFTVPGGEPVRVVLEVYDLLGRRIAELVRGEVDPGVHSVVWDAAGMSSGVYHCRLTTDAQAQTHPMMLVR
jgi:hypothetical protein